jgi:hypothetical protein
VWFIDSPGLTQLATVPATIPFDTTSFHTLRMTFHGTVIDVYYDKRPRDDARRTRRSPTASSRSTWRTQPVQFDDVTVWLGVPANTRACPWRRPDAPRCPSSGRPSSFR